MTTGAPEALRTDTCPNLEQLAAYVEAGLPRLERTLVERHLLECADCREVVADSVAINDEMDRGAVPAVPTRIWWMGLGAVLAAAAAIALALTR
jgi:predicted anti-sigma-YlaC factor YlaD